MAGIDKTVAKMRSQPNGVSFEEASIVAIPCPCLWGAKTLIII